MHGHTYTHSWNQFRNHDSNDNTALKSCDFLWEIWWKRASRNNRFESTTQKTKDETKRKTYNNVPIVWTVRWWTKRAELRFPTSQQPLPPPPPTPLHFFLDISIARSLSRTGFDARKLYALFVLFFIVHSTHLLALSYVHSSKNAPLLYVIICSPSILAVILFLHLFCFVLWLLHILSSNLWKLCYWRR